MTGVDANLNSLDIYLPPAGEDDDCTGRPLVVWVHGGGWHEGDKTDDIGDKVRLFTGAGYAFASVNYRLTDVTLEPPAPQYPVHDQDTADAVAWLVAHADAARRGRAPGRPAGPQRGRRHRRRDHHRRQVPGRPWTRPRRGSVRGVNRWRGLRRRRRRDPP